RERSVTTQSQERFRKLLLGEDMSASGKGVCANSIDDGYVAATVFVQSLRLQPLSIEKKD
ncbi:unnamed protein product, partial [Brassica rapa subsp. narinosa]